MTAAFKQKFLREAYEKDENLVSTTRQIDKSHPGKARCRTPSPGNGWRSNLARGMLKLRIDRYITSSTEYCVNWRVGALAPIFQLVSSLFLKKVRIFVSKFASHVIKVTRTDKNIVGADLLVTPQKPCNSSLLSYLQVPPSRKQFRLKFVTIF